ncbi:MAG: hypothetical protein DMF68_18725 [Acidobacteria bacterium]|nr:MAG: hypothetical protein DMF68_18725 [Acidobacteriota bacterium]
MKLTMRVLLACALCLVILPAAFAQKRRGHQAAVSIGGVYEHFSVGKGSGDLEGMRVAIFAAGGSYHAIVQAAQGGAEDPEPKFADVSVKGNTVSFTAGGISYTGTVTAAGLRLKDEGLLKRTPCSSYFSGKP